MTSQEVRQQFINFFISKGHNFVRSSSVVPVDDPTLLFTNAGMNQFKPLFLGTKSPENRRVVNSQKCIRVSGKHNDLEEVGVDDYHHTFFEMLGNWSFGDYYKQEAIEWAWELLTETWKMDKSRLWVTIYQDDNESREQWKKCTDISEDRILKFGNKDNFWEMGDAGPCGPCTEIHYYTGDNPDNQKASGVNADPEYREIWNIVFIQYNRDKKGNLNELPEKHVDTGAGLERIVAILNGETSNYETDLFIPVINKISKISNFSYTSDTGVAHRVIADHLRMLVFSIADGAMPGNDGRGYVLRRVLRRAARFGRTIGLTKPFFRTLVPSLIEIMDKSFPELKEKQTHIEKVISAEEKSFGKTLDKGIDIFYALINNMNPGNTISGEDVFKLYDTYGFPVDLTSLMAREKQLLIDSKKFEILMEEQKRHARKTGRFQNTGVKGDWIVTSNGDANNFTGYKESESESKIRKYRKLNGNTEIVLDNTPFYAEQGGQIGDTGTIKNDSFTFIVKNTTMDQDDIVHFGRIEKGEISKVEKVITLIDSERRQKIRLNHTATHLLHQAMKNVLGDHVHQAGSLVAEDRLRFDFTHSEKLAQDEKIAIEQMVNVEIRKNTAVTTTLMDYESARKSGATAQFGEKYGIEVRVVEVVGFSTELCGGTHVARTGEIGAFKITSETSLSSGVRRIEALTGIETIKLMNENENLIQNIKELMKCSIEQIPERLESIITDKQQLEKKFKNQQLSYGSDIVTEILSNSEEIFGVQVVVDQIDYSGDLMLLGDQIREKFNKKGISLLGTIIDSKPMVLCTITDSLLDTFHAGNIVKEVGSKMGGGGGGKAHIAKAGGKDPAILNKALAFGKSIIYSKLNNG